jgi:hypothetical protein
MSEGPSVQREDGEGVVLGVRGVIVRSKRRVVRELVSDGAGGGGLVVARRDQKACTTWFIWVVCSDCSEVR